MNAPRIIRSVQQQFSMKPDGTMVNMHQDPYTSAGDMMSQGVQEFFRTQHGSDHLSGNFSEAGFIRDGKYVEQEIVLFWDAPVSEMVTLGGAIVCLVLLDSYFVRRLSQSGLGIYKAHAVMALSWISCGLAYNVLYGYRHGTREGIDFFIGYMLEWMLSLDNLFAFQFIVRTYRAPEPIQHKALMAGVIGALFWRMGLFLAIGSIMHMIKYVQFLFGMFLVYAGVQALHDDDDSETDPRDLFLNRMLKKLLGTRLTDGYDEENHSLFIRDQDGRSCATLLVPLIFCIQVADVMFAVDSVSAKVAQIPNQYTAYSSSVFALLALPAMFFVVNDLVRYFDKLKYGVCCILIFIGCELMISGRYQLPDWIVCIVIVTIFNVCIVVSQFCKIVWPESGGESQESVAELEADSCGGAGILGEGASIGDLGATPLKLEGQSEEVRKHLLEHLASASELQRPRTPDQSIEKEGMCGDPSSSANAPFRSCKPIVQEIAAADSAAG